MNKAGNTLLWILLGSLLNLVVMIVLLAVFVLIAVVVSNFSDLAMEQLLPFAFILTLISSMFLYQRIAKWAMNRFKLGEKMVPLFGKKQAENRD